jgi:hypothetical protein
MSKPIIDYKARPKLVELAPHEAVTIMADRGTQVRVLQGALWITQEGDSEDHIVTAGTRFHSAHKGTIVVSALERASRASVSWMDPGHVRGDSRSDVQLDYGQIEQLQNAARQARAKELARLVSSGFARLARVWGRIGKRRRPGARTAPHCTSAVHSDLRKLART